MLKKSKKNSKTAQKSVFPRFFSKNLFKSQSASKKRRNSSVCPPVVNDKIILNLTQANRHKSGRVKRRSLKRWVTKVFKNSKRGDEKQTLQKQRKVSKHHRAGVAHQITTKECLQFSLSAADILVRDNCHQSAANLPVTVTKSYVQRRPHYTHIARPRISSNCSKQENLRRRRPSSSSRPRYVVARRSSRSNCRHRRTSAAKQRKNSSRCRKSSSMSATSVKVALSLQDRVFDDDTDSYVALSRCSTASSWRLPSDGGKESSFIQEPDTSCNELSQKDHGFFQNETTYSQDHPKIQSNLSRKQKSKKFNSVKLRAKKFLSRRNSNRKKATIAKCQSISCCEKVRSFKLKNWKCCVITIFSSVFVLGKLFGA